MVHVYTNTYKHGTPITWYHGSVYTPQRPALCIPPLLVDHFHVTIAHCLMFTYYTLECRLMLY